MCAAARLHVQENESTASIPPAMYADITGFFLERGIEKSTETYVIFYFIPRCGGGICWKHLDVFKIIQEKKCVWEREASSTHKYITDCVCLNGWFVHTIIILYIRWYTRTRRGLHVPHKRLTLQFTRYKNNYIAYVCVTRALGRIPG